jgi:hypothetical protein
MKTSIFFAFFFAVVGCGPAYYTGPAMPTVFSPFAAPAGLMPPPPVMGQGLVAYLGAWPYQKGPRVVEIINDTEDWFMLVYLGGQRVRIMEDGKRISYLPPKGRAYTYTYVFGDIPVGADAFIPPLFNPPLWNQRVAHLPEATTVCFSPKWGHQEVWLQTQHFKND